MAAEEDLERTEIEAVLETRRELGLRYDAELVNGFADRIERAVDQRVADELARRKRADAAAESAGGRQLALGIISLVACIPICIALGVNDKATALLVALAAIVAVNFAHAWQGKR
jgi:hypothetical protein